MALKRPSFGASAFDGMESYQVPRTSQEQSVSDISQNTKILEPKHQEASSPKHNVPESHDETMGNKYYNYHPKTGNRGGTLGAPRISDNEKKVSVSFTCTKAQKELYRTAAAADGRNFPAFVNQAILEYIENHNLI